MPALRLSWVALCAASAFAVLAAGCDKSADTPPARPAAPDAAPVSLQQGLADLIGHLDVQHPGRGVTDYPGNTVEDIPKSYALVAKAALAYPGTARLDQAGASALAWLRGHAGLDPSGIPGWGVPVAWDAFGDGSVNPASANYTISTAIVCDALMDYAAAPSTPAADGQAAIGLCAQAMRPYLPQATRSPSGMPPYSLTPADRPYDVFNPAAYLAGQAQRLSQLVQDPALAGQLRELADTTMGVMLAQHKTTQAGNWYWAYSIQEDVPNDLPHASYVIRGILDYAEHGGKLASQYDLPAVKRHVADFVDPAQGYIRAWPAFRADVNNGARSYDLGFAMGLVCREPGFEAGLRARLVDAIRNYRQPDGRYTKYPTAGAGMTADTPLVVNEYESYLLFGLAQCASHPAPAPG